MKQMRASAIRWLLVLGLASAGAVWGQATFVVGGIQRDPSGAILEASTTTNSNFPVTPGAYQTTFTSVVACSSGPPYHAVICPHGIIAKYGPAGNSMIWATFLGGTTGGEFILGTALDPQNNLWIAGSTTSTDFPTTGDAVQKAPGGYFLSELSSDGSHLLYSSFADLPVSLISASGNAIYLAGMTGGRPFSGTPGAYRTTPDPGANELYVIRFDPAARKVAWATLVGPVDLLAKIIPGDDGTLYIGGTTSEAGFPITQGVYSRRSQSRGLFFAAIRPDGSDLAFSTVVGGSGDTTLEDMVTDEAGNFLVAALATLSGLASLGISPDLPVTADAMQPQWGGVYLIKLAPDASRLLYASYMGNDSLTTFDLIAAEVTKIQLGPDGKLHMMWTSDQSDIPLTPDSYGPCYPELAGAYIGHWAYVRLTSDLKTIDYATSGGTAAGYLPYYFDTSGNFYLQGTGANYFDILNVSQAPHPGPVCVAEYVTKRQSAIAPGLLVSIYGPGIGPSQPTGAVLDASGNVANQLAGTQVLFDGLPAPILYAEPSHIDAVAPFGLATSGNTKITVLQNGNLLGTLTAPLQPQLLRMFSTDGTGYGTVFWNQDGTPNSQANPAHVGDILTLYLTGAGQMTPQPANGAIPAAPASVPQIALSIGASNCPVTYVGDAPGEVEGIVQINCQLQKGAGFVWVQSAHDSSPENWNAVFSK
jgi:uncharacterized protein (TIGR03437 family)